MHLTHFGRARNIEGKDLQGRCKEGGVQLHKLPPPGARAVPIVSLSQHRSGLRRILDGVHNIIDKVHRILEGYIGY